MDLIERNPKKWRRVYILDEKLRANSGMVFGRQMADSLENGEMTGDPVLDLMIEKLPKFEIMDKPVEAVLKTAEGKKIRLLAKPDTMKADGTAFKEYKTGQEPWTQKKVDGSGQIDFYATTLYLKNGFIPTDVELVQVLTAKQGNGSLDVKIGATGDILRFKRVVTTAQVLKMMVRMKRAWELIEKICEEEFL